MGMERIVRPFEADSPFTARKLPPAPLNTEPAANVVVEWGKPMPVDYDKHVWSGVFGFKNVYRETARVTKTERIYQNNNPNSSNYVDVQRIQKLNLQSNQGDEIVLDLA